MNAAVRSQALASPLYHDSYSVQSRCADTSASRSIADARMTSHAIRCRCRCRASSSTPLSTFASWENSWQSLDAETDLGPAARRSIDRSRSCRDWRSRIARAAAAPPAPRGASSIDARPDASLAVDEFEESSPSLEGSARNVSEGTRRPPNQRRRREKRRSKFHEAWSGGSRVSGCAEGAVAASESAERG